MFSCFRVFVFLCFRVFVFSCFRVFVFSCFRVFVFSCFRVLVDALSREGARCKVSSRSVKCSSSYDWKCCYRPLRRRRPRPPSRSPIGGARIQTTTVLGVKFRADRSSVAAVMTVFVFSCIRVFVYSCFSVFVFW